jgi:16S rRNA (cytosine967-C5)-methyltransferase
MRDGGKLSAAIDVLADMEARHRPIHLALKGWGDRARYAGAKDRAFVSGLVLDILRHRRSLAWRMGEESDRARALAALRWLWDWDAVRVAAAAADEHGPGALTGEEAQRLALPNALEDAPVAVRGDYPDWLDASLARVFGDRRGAELATLATRAPVDLRVNPAKSDVEHVLKALSALDAQPAPLLAGAIRLAPPAAAERAAPVEAAPAFERGAFEVQDLGSQIAAACAGDIKGRQVLDLCAGGGGKTLALGAAMANTGQLYAFDSDPRRLKDTVSRSERAGLRNLQIRSPLEKDALKDLEGHMDLVFVDAPCTGSGTWRRHPDTKWRLSERQLQMRMAEQDKVLGQAAAYVKPGGRLVYVTCSVLAEEDEDRVAAFRRDHPDFSVAPIPVESVASFVTADGFLRLTPLNAATDGFFVAVLERSV